MKCNVCPLGKNTGGATASCMATMSLKCASGWKQCGDYCYKQATLSGSLFKAVQVCVKQQFAARPLWFHDGSEISWIQSTFMCVRMYVCTCIGFGCLVFVYYKVRYTSWDDRHFTAQQCLWFTDLIVCMCIQNMRQSGICRVSTDCFCASHMGTKV
jgi:hypothetical protein